MRDISDDELVSVMVPVYFGEKYVVDCLESIRNQTYPNIELLISDDCSMDESFEVINDWVRIHKERFVRCEVSRHDQNVGISKNYNYLLKKAKGKYLKSIAYDDLFMEDAIEKEVGFLKDNPDDVAVYANAYIIKADDHYPLSKGKKYELFFCNKPNYQGEMSDALFNGSFIPAPTVMLKMETLEKYGFYREDLAFEDWEYWLRITTGGGNIGYLDHPVVGYRMLEFSASHFGTGKDEEARYKTTIESEIKILDNYKDKVNNSSMDAYWNRTLKFCIDRGYDGIIKDINNNVSFCMQPMTRLMLVSKRMGVYKILKKIWFQTKHGR